MQIRQEINILDTTLTTNTTSGVTTSVQLDTSKYNGTVTYYFEALAKNTNVSSSRTVLLSGGVTNPSLTIPANTTSYTLFRTTFTPDSTLNEYFVNGGEASGSDVTVKAARIIIIQNATPITKTETQIEIGNESNTLTTTDTPLTNPKYWKYTAANWNGTITAYFEGVFKTGTSKSAATMTLQVADGTGDGFTGWANVTDGAVTTITTQTARVRATNFQAEAQAFKIRATSTITGVKLFLAKVGSPTDTLNVDIVSSLGGSSLANVTQSASALTTSYLEYNLTFGTPVSLTGGPTYYIQLTRSPDTADATNYILWSHTASGYSDGASQQRNSNSWASGAVDHQFTLIGQAGVTLLEPQYLLAKTLFAAGPALQIFPTKWDSTEWSGINNVYTFKAEAADGSTSDVTLEEADGGGTAATVTNIDNAGQATATMPADQNMDTKATTNAGDVAAARILVNIYTTSTTSSTSTSTSTSTTRSTSTSSSISTSTRTTRSTSTTISTSTSTSTTTLAPGTGKDVEVPIEILDTGGGSLNFTVVTLSAEVTFLYPIFYDGATEQYFFEIVAQNPDSVARDVDLWNVDAGSATATISVPTSAGTPTRIRSGTFTPVAANTEYTIRLAQTTSKGQLQVFAARIIVKQIDAGPTRIQIPLINGLRSGTSTDRKSTRLNSSHGYI